MIRKEHGLYVLRSKTTGRRLGSFVTLSAAEKREKQIQFFKRRNP